jgi:hypothetical protein
VGTKLCEKHHTKLIAGLRRLKIRAALCSLRRDLVRHVKQKGSLTAVQIEQMLEAPEHATPLDAAQKRRALAYLVLCWLEDFGADLQGEYFPFDLPSLALYRRYRTVHGWLVRAMARIDSPHQAFSTLETIRHHLAIVVQDQELVATAERLEKAARLFNELRQVLRLGSLGPHRLGHQGLVADGPLISREREEGLEKWTEQLHQRRASGSDADQTADLTVVLDYLQKYHGKLTGHVIALHDYAEPFVVQRTNNVSEHRFGRTKQGLRRKLGTKKLARYVQAMRPEEFLVANLQDPDYLQIICGGSLENLSLSFAQNWQAGQTIRSQRKEKTSNHPIPAKRKILRADGFLSKLQQAATNMIQNIMRKGAAA